MNYQADTYDIRIYTNMETLGVSVEPEPYIPNISPFHSHYSDQALKYHRSSAHFISLNL